MQIIFRIGDFFMKRYERFFVEHNLQFVIVFGQSRATVKVDFRHQATDTELPELLTSKWFPGDGSDRLAEVVQPT